MKNETKLVALRNAMLESNLSAVVIPSNDPHQSEYVATHWKAREWITGFTGSAGVAVVTLNEAGLWTDSRYFLQAEQELAGSGVTFHKQTIAGAPEHIDWLKANLKRGDRLGYDGKLLSIEAHASLKSAFASLGIELITDADPVAKAWSDRPALPLDPVFGHRKSLTGLSAREKIANVRAAMQSFGVDHHLLVSLDDIAWLLNLRGRDVDYNPVFYGYALIGLQSAALFVDPRKVSVEVREMLLEAGVEVHDYASIAAQLAACQGKILLDESIVSVSLRTQIGPACTVVNGASPSTAMKARKDDTEIRHIRHAMEKDGLALLRLCRWLETELGKPTLTEYAVGEQLAAFRAEQANYFGESFPAIAGYAGNGAIVHYRPAAQGSAVLHAEGVFLLDSGGQYADGTTDITRTFALGPVTDAAIKAYTLVLKGHIGIATARFPRGTVGYQLDPLARIHLWSAGMNYGHGTGHGVGYFLNVHEGPQGISPLANVRSRTPIEPGMVISNEPGYYEAGEFGIRIENLVLCVEDKELGGGNFLRFETLSLFPIEATMIDWSLLHKGEIEWLRDYHYEVLSRIGPLLNADEHAWLMEKCAPYCGEVTP